MIKLSMNGFEVNKQDGIMLRRYIENISGNVLAQMSKDCYYPRVASFFKELMHKTNTNEKLLKDYSKHKWPNYKFRLLHDPYTTLLILIIQYFLNEKKDEVGAIWTFNYFALRTYSNLMFRYIKLGCNSDYWRFALENLSHSHIFKQKKTIGNSVLYYSTQVYKIYKPYLIKDDPEKIKDCILSIRTRINQSLRSFYNKYYSAKDEQEKIKSKSEDEIYNDKSFENSVLNFSNRVSKDICVYGKINREAIYQSRQITRFNKLLSLKYIETLKNSDISDQLEVLFVLMFKGLNNTKQVCSVQFLDHIKKLMSVKTSTKPVYFKKNLIILHDTYIIPKLDLTKWFNERSVQTKKVSRDYLAYYLALFIKSYIC